MALNDLIVFDEAKAKMVDGNWGSTDVFYCAVCDNTTTPTRGFSTPLISEFTQIGTGGSYAGPANLGALSVLVTESDGVMKFDSTTNPNWEQHVDNDVDAYWAIIYNFVSGDCLGYVDLGGPLDMSTGDLTVTWNDLGIFSIT